MSLNNLPEIVIQSSSYKLTKLTDDFFFQENKNSTSSSLYPPTIGKCMPVVTIRSIQLKMFLKWESCFISITS